MMNSGPAHPPSSARRALMRAGLLATVVGAALGGGAVTASAADEGAGGSSPQEAIADGITAPVVHSARGVLYAAAGPGGVVKNTPIDPLANTGADPLDNGVRTQVADFREIGTDTVTGPIARGASLSDLPVGSTVTRLLPG